MSTTRLSDRMRARADADGLPADHDLRAAADAFDTAALGFYAQPQAVPVHKFFSYYARVRKVWRAYSGEPLV